MSKWSCEDEKRFQAALLCYPEDFPNRWEKIAEVVGFSMEMVCQRYQILQIESGQVSPPQYTNSSTNNQPHKNNKGSSWTYEEHVLLLLRELKYGKRHRKNISKKAVPPNKALLCASGIYTEDMDKQEDNEVDMDDHECGNINADNSPSQTHFYDCGNAHLAVDDDNRQSPDTLNTAGPGASGNASLGSRKVVVEILDSDDDECIASGTLNGKEASCDIAPAVDDIGRSSVSGLFESLKRKWFPEGGNSFDGLNKNLVDGSDTDDDMHDSSSSTSFSESGINKVQFPLDFVCSTGGKRRKT